MPREPVVIERGRKDNRAGTPRPLARNNGTLRPVPWTNDAEWGILHQDRSIRSSRESKCLVCGYQVDEGFIFTADKDCPTAVDSLMFAVDGGPLHARCAKMTVAHCAHVRDSLRLSEMFMVPYCRQIA